MTPEPGSAAMERAFDDLVFEYGGLCYDEGHEKRNHDTADGDAARLYHEILSAFAVLTRERDEAREALKNERERWTGIGSAVDLISDWISEGTEDLPDDTPVRVEIGKRAIILDSLKDLRAALSKEKPE